MYNINIYIYIFAIYNICVYREYIYGEYIPAICFAVHLHGTAICILPHGSDLGRVRPQRALQSCYICSDSVLGLLAFAAKAMKRARGVGGGAARRGAPWGGGGARRGAWGGEGGMSPRWFPL